jgi:hypothetical protein
LHVLSLGAGVQSSTLALMFAAGELKPMPDGAIFADTGGEPRHVYTWLDWLETRLPFPVYRVMHKEGLTANIHAAIDGGRFAGAPFFTESDHNSAGQLRRQCTREFKVQPITRKVRELVGLKYRQRAPRKILAVQYIGISFDEVIRMRTAREHWITNKWPLVDLEMRRQDCLDWMKAQGHPEPQRSACSYCPYHSDAEWRNLQKQSPDDFAVAVDIDRRIRAGVRGTTQKLYLHRSLKPLDAIEFKTAADYGQVDMFENDCEGLCGV